jgi:hypothetical protein
MKNTSPYPSIFEFNDFRKFLAEYHKVKQVQEPLFSMAAVSKMLGLPNTRSYFADVIHGKHVSPVFVERFVRVFELKTDEARFFRVLIKFNQAENAEERELYFDQLIGLNKTPKRILSKKYFIYYKNWYNSVIRALLNIIDFTGDYKLLSRKVLPPIYRIERYATAKNLSVDQRYALRQQYSKPVMDKIKAAILKPDFILLPQGRIGKAINYMLNHWDRTMRFLERGDLPIDNGIDERIIRDLAIGRKNWIHVMSDRGGKWMAILYSLIATCKLNNINPEEYLGDVLMRIGMRSADASVRDLIPTEWLKARNGGKLPEKQPLYPSIN